MILLGKMENINSSFFEYDLGSRQSVSIREFVETVHRLTASNTHLVFGALPYREGEVMNSEANISGLKAFGWRCRYDLETGLAQVLKQERTYL